MNEIKVTNSNDVTRTTESSREITPEAFDNNIIEVLYKHLVTEMETWLLIVLGNIATVYGAWCVGDRYGTWAERSYYLKIIGFPPEVELTKKEIVKFRKFIETQISKRGYVDRTQIASYAFGLSETIAQGIKEGIKQRKTCKSWILSKSRSAKLADYMYKRYGLTTDRGPNIDLGRDDKAYYAGRSDGYDYFKDNNSKDDNPREALISVLKNTDFMVKPRSSKLLR